MNWSLRNLPVKYQLGLFGAVAFLVVVLFLQFAMGPQRVRSAALSGDIAMEKQRVAIIEYFALTYPDAAGHAAQLSSQLARNNQLLPAEADIGGVLILMEEAARDSGVIIGQIQPGKAVPKNNYQEIPIALTVKGSYYQILDFTRRLEGARRFAAISFLSLQAKEGLLTGKITVNVYAQAQGGAVPPAASGRPPVNPPQKAP